MAVWQPVGALYVDAIATLGPCGLLEPWRVIVSVFAVVTATVINSYSPVSPASLHRSYSHTFENKSSLAPPNPAGLAPAGAAAGMAADDDGATAATGAAATGGALFQPPKSSSALTLG